MLIIQSSHRNNGTTAAASKELASLLDAKVLDLCNYEISHFNYSGPGTDDFEKVIKLLIENDEVVFATPIYWYTMSGMLKVFLDRISDLLKWDKDLGRKLRGKRIHLISVSGHDDPPIHFPYPFRMTADYLGMSFGNYVHICPGKEERIIGFAKSISSSLD